MNTLNVSHHGLDFLLEKWNSQELISWCVTHRGTSNIFKACFISECLKIKRRSPNQFNCWQKPKSLWSIPDLWPCRRHTNAISPQPPPTPRCCKMSGIHPELNFTFALWKGWQCGSSILAQKDVPHSYRLWTWLVLVHPRAMAPEKSNPECLSLDGAAIFHLTSPSLGCYVGERSE